MIELKIINQKLELKKTNYLVNWSHNYLKIHFNFTTGDWTEREKYCLIQVKNKYYRFNIEDDKLVLPSQVLTYQNFRISVFGTSGEDDSYSRITTNQLRVKLAESGYTTDISPIDPVPRDVFEIIFEELEARVKWDDVDTILDIHSSNPVSNSIVAESLENKSDVGHTHETSDITDLDSVTESEIQKGFITLESMIRRT